MTTAPTIPVLDGVPDRMPAFDMEVGYCARGPKFGRTERYFADVETMAAWADALVVACAATPATRGLVDGRVLAALGPEGVLVNVARGAIVDEPALVAAVQGGTIAGAALDVFADEPRVPEALFALDNVVLTPHIGSATTETRKAMADATIAALDVHFGHEAKTGL